MGLILAFGSPSVAQASCTVQSATITYSADDYLNFWINGNQVLNGTFFDAGNPPQTVTINPAFFNAGATPNYFAASVVNSLPSVLGATWLISIVCADGSLSYITSGDNAFIMYDDNTGGAPPPLNGANSWYQPAWVDAGNIFSQPPVSSTGIAWFSPSFLTNPLTGAQIPVLSHSASGTEAGDHEVLYFRESLVLPEFTLTPTPTPYPTVCGATPAYVSSAKLGSSGCAGSGNPTSFTYTVPTGPGEILLAQVETGNSSLGLTGVTWNGVALTQLPGSPVPITGGGDIFTYYMVNPPAGTFTLAFLGVNGCSWNPVVSVYNNVDTSSPFGTITSTSNTGSNKVVDTITTVSPYSIIHDFYAYPSGPYTYSGITGTQLFPPASSNCCDDAFGSYLNASAPLLYTLNYPNTGGPNTWTSETIELKAVQSCGGSPTDTPTPAPPSATPSPTPTVPTKTPTKTFTPPPPGSTLTDTPTVTPTITSTFTPGPSATPAPPAGPGFGIVAVYPNPVPGTGCFFVMSVPGPMTVHFKVYDLRGEMIWSGSQDYVAGGVYQKPWAATNNAGAAISYGAYFLTANAGSASDSKWLTVVR
jgi:hypothetical protein